MRLRLSTPVAPRALRKPLPSSLPSLQMANLAAKYRAARVGGDFFDFRMAGRLLVFLLLDIAGQRDEALNIAAAAQETFRGQTSKLFTGEQVNEANALNEMAVALNRSIMEAAKGVRFAPGFLGCYDENLGSLFYINAGHMPALLKDVDGVTLMEASGLPLGLFSHATHDSQISVVRPGAVVLVVSKGLVESKCGHQEFGLERLRAVLAGSQSTTSSKLCAEVLASVEQFCKTTPDQNDITAVALMRTAAVAAPEMMAAATSQ